MPLSGSVGFRAVEDDYVLSPRCVALNGCITRAVRARFDTALRPASVPPLPCAAMVERFREEPHQASQRAYGSRPKDVLDGWPAGSQTEESRKESRTDVSVRPLRIDVMGADLLSEAVREVAVRRVLLALSRFGGDVRHSPVHDDHRPDQLALRLPHLRDPALGVPRIDESAAVPHRIV